MFGRTRGQCWCCMAVSDWSISRISTLVLYASGKGDASVTLPIPLPLIFSINLPKSTAAPKDKVTSRTSKPVVSQPPPPPAMSSPRRTRNSQSATPSRSTRNGSEANETPRAGGSRQPEQSLFYQSSSPAPSGQNGLPGDVSSPFGQMTNSQSTRAPSGIPSSPMHQMTDTQSDVDPERTPRANPTTPAFHGGKVVDSG